MIRGAGQLVLGVALLATSACDVDPRNPPPRFRLEGSLGQVMDLGYDEARVLIAPEDLSLVFVRKRPLASLPDDAGTTNPDQQGFSEDYPIKIAWRLLMDELPRGGRVDLAEEDAGGRQRGTVSRNVFNDPRTTFPRLARGTMRFDRPLDPDTVVGGDFHLTFENGIEVASGRTCFSTAFTARVQP